MATVGTAHIKIKPVLDEQALIEVASRIEAAVAEAVRRGIDAGSRVTIVNVANVAEAPCDCTWCKRDLEHPTTQ